jgi:hypothetical protein
MQYSPHSSYLSHLRPTNYRKKGFRAMKILLAILSRHKCIHCCSVQQNLSTYFTYLLTCGSGSPVGIATGYGLDSPGIESRWGSIFSAPVQTGPGAHLASCTMSTGSYPAVESGRGVTLTPHPILVPRSKNRVELYLYSPYGPSWPIKKGETYLPLLTYLLHGAELFLRS